MCNLLTAPPELLQHVNVEATAESLILRVRSNPIALPGFEPGSPDPKPDVLDHYTIGLFQTS